MAFRAPRYSYVHAARDAGVAGISLSAIEDPDFPVDNLIDDRAGTLFKFNASHGSPYFQVDLGAVTGIDRIIIPANHDIALPLRVRQASDEAFTADILALKAYVAPTPGTLYDGEFHTPSSARYIRAEISGTALVQLSQLFFSKIATLTVGPTLANAVDTKRANVTRLIQDNGQSPTVQNGPQQRYLEYEYEYALSTDNLTAVEALIDSVGMTHPFFVDPAEFHATPGTDEPALWMKFDRMPDSSYAVDVPMSGTRKKTYRLRLIESLD